MTENASAADARNRSTKLLGNRGRLLTLGSLVGVVAGMGSFMYIKASFIPWGVDPAWALVLVAIAGAYAHFFSEDLADSITLSLVAVVVGLGIHVTAWIAPLWILNYPPAARDLLLPGMLGRAVSSGILAYLLTFYAAYFTVLLVGGVLDP
ncbi:hypothetical protein [Halorussus halophilus]|uniref:hypothetical protein n=1 Tax=Halorussus halophilus TaxID=2650975 RepID=UPI0013014D31|nr:hypothetical protein [Halorussus halophilus]